MVPVTSIDRRQGDRPPSGVEAQRSGRVPWIRRHGMVAVLDDKAEALAALCRKYSVERLYVFGSALRDDFRAGESDIDLLVEFAPIGGHAKMHAYFDMLDELQELLRTKVDLVMVGAVQNKYIAREIEATKRVLYAA
jgi:uncharacterized protein